MDAMFESNFPTLKMINKGKVREIYEIGDKILFVTSDRISAFDVIMNEPVPGKGAILSQISAFWFTHTRHIVKNHFITNNPDEYPEECKPYRKDLVGRSMLVKKCKTLPIECIVRGYIAGSGWKSYQQAGKICGIEIPAGLRQYEKLPEPIFTPSTKATSGHDENISFEETCKIIGIENAEKSKNILSNSIALHPIFCSAKDLYFQIRNSNSEPTIPEKLF